MVRISLSVVYQFNIGRGREEIAPPDPGILAALHKQNQRVAPRPRVTVFSISKTTLSFRDLVFPNKSHA